MGAILCGKSRGFLSFPKSAAYFGSKSASISFVISGTVASRGTLEYGFDLVVLRIIRFSRDTAKTAIPANNGCPYRPNRRAASQATRPAFLRAFSRYEGFAQLFFILSRIVIDIAFHKIIYRNGNHLILLRETFPAVNPL
jgi:hypothetical protein